MENNNFLKKISFNDTLIISAITIFGYFTCYVFELAYAKEIGYSIYLISIDFISLVILGIVFVLTAYIVLVFNFLIERKIWRYIGWLIFFNIYLLLLYYFILPENSLLTFFYIKLALIICNLVFFFIFVWNKLKHFKVFQFLLVTSILPFFTFVVIFGGEYASISYEMRDNLNTIQYNDHKYGILRVYSGNIIAVNLDNTDDSKREILYIPKEQTHIITINKK